MKIAEKYFALSLLACLPVLASAQEVASLYGPQPPADAAYARVVNASADSAKIALLGSNEPKPVALNSGASTRYVVLKPADKIQMSVAGKAVGAMFSVPAGERMTIGLTRNGKNWHTQLISERAGRNDKLKVSLQVFNLAPACSGKIGIAGGPAVFEQVESGTSKARSINPVTARLVGACDAAKGGTSKQLALPQLNAGDSYSLFLTGDAARPILFGVHDAISWPPTNY